MAGRKRHSPVAGGPVDLNCLLSRAPYSAIKDVVARSTYSEMLRQSSQLVSSEHDIVANGRKPDGQDEDHPRQCAKDEQKKGHVCAIGVDLRPAMPLTSPPWSMPLEAKTSNWRKHETWNSLQDVLDVGEPFRQELCLLFTLGGTFTKLCELPWAQMAQTIAHGIQRRGASLETAQAIMDMKQLESYMKKWMKKSSLVKKVVEWKLFTCDDAARRLSMLCRPGAYLADLMMTFVAIERDPSRSTSAHIVIFNNVYLKLAQRLDIVQRNRSSEFNVGNVLECLCWLAYEQQRYEFIITVVHHAADIQFDNNEQCLLRAPEPSELREDERQQEPVRTRDNVKRHNKMAVEQRTKLSRFNEQQVDERVSIDSVAVQSMPWRQPVAATQCPSPGIPFAAARTDKMEVHKNDDIHIEQVNEQFMQSLDNSLRDKIAKARHLLQQMITSPSP